MWLEWGGQGKRKPKEESREEIRPDRGGLVGYCKDVTFCCNLLRVLSKMGGNLPTTLEGSLRL